LTFGLPTFGQQKSYVRKSISNAGEYDNARRQIH